MDGFGPRRPSNPPWAGQGGVLARQVDEIYKREGAAGLLNIAKDFLLDAGKKAGAYAEKNPSAVDDFMTGGAAHKALYAAAADPTNMAENVLPHAKAWKAANYAVDALGLGFGGVLAGRKARGSPMDKIDEAVGLLDAGSFPPKVWKSHGVALGSEGQPRWEIDDTAARFTGLEDEGLDYIWYTPLEEVFQHDKLYEAYPQLRGKVTLSQQDHMPRGNAMADWDSGEIMGNFRGMDAEEIKDLLLHEVTHHIQNIEGFSLGGAPEGFDRTALDQLIKQRGSLIDERMEIEDVLDDPDMPDAEAEYYSRRFDTLSDSISRTLREMEGMDPYDRYHRLGGEVEARNVPRRAGLSAQQRTSTPPELTEDTLRADQIIYTDPDNYPSHAWSASDQSPKLLDPDVSMYDLPPGSKPEYLGAMKDRSEYTHLRYRPKDLSPKISGALDALRNNDNGLKDALIADIRRGQELGGDDWYNTEELRGWFVKELGEEAGDAEWREFMHLMGATSTGNKVDSNIGIAAMYRHQGIGAQGLARRHLDRAKGETVLPKGHGHKMQNNHAQNVISHRSGEWVPDPDYAQAPSKGKWLKNPKPKGFAASLLGNARNIAADLHFTRYMGMAANRPDWLVNDGEVAASVLQDLRQKYGKKIDKYVVTTGKNPKLRARKLVEDGVAEIGDFADTPAVWQGRPTDIEYAAFEDYINELGDELGMTGAQVQANLWMGAADRTGVDPSSQGTFMELIRKRADKRAAAEGMTRAEVLKRFITERGMLAVPGAVGTGLLMGGVAEDDRGPR